MTVLLMGFSWSLFFAQKANEMVASLAPSLSLSRLVHDRSDPSVVGSGERRHYVYVDNLGCLSSDGRRVALLVDQRGQLFDSEALLLHKAEIGTVVKSLGCAVDGMRVFGVHGSPHFAPGCVLGGAASRCMRGGGELDKRRRNA